MELNQNFRLRMQTLLKEEYPSFIKTYDEAKYQGLRVNPFKVTPEEFLRVAPFSLESIPWITEGFYYTAQDRPGKHPYHEAGLYYIQEPSAMAVAEALAPLPGEKVLDLCAAPGGKTTQIAAKMCQQGLLVANEVHPARVRILSQNVERMGIRNAVVTNEPPGKLVQRFPSFFDRILVDAPCSGEGMFRKDPQACGEWSLENVGMCADRQVTIINDAAKMLRPGGRLVYSTCTFSPEENERLIYRFITENLDFELEKADIYEGFAAGRPDWIEEKLYNHHLSKEQEKAIRESIRRTTRIWPHQVQGEGHYLAVLKKKNGGNLQNISKGHGLVQKNPSSPVVKKQLLEFERFTEEFLKKQLDGRYTFFGDQLYIIPEDMVSLEKLKVVRPGWHIGASKKNRFEPSHALAVSLCPNDVNFHWNLSSDSEEIRAYLRGEAIQATGNKGWYMITVDGYSLGWGKLIDQTLKNHYPKGLRWVK